MKLFLATVIVLATLPSLTRDGACQGDVTVDFVSDPSWDSYEMNPDGTLGPAVGPAQYVCVSCQQRACPPGATIFHHPCGWGADLSAIPGAAWVWLAGVTGATMPADLQGTLISKTFDVSGAPTSGKIYLAVDDFAEVIVNGTVVGSSGSVTDYDAAVGAQGALKEFDLAPFLVTGSNVITVRAQNGPASYTGTGGCNPCDYSGNPAGVVFGGSFSYAMPTVARSGTWGSVKIRYR